MLYLRVSLFCKTVFVTSGSQFSRGPICRTNILQGPNLPPRGPICRGPICRGPICHHQIFRGPICRTQNFPGPNLPGPNLPGPNLPGPNLPRTFSNGGTRQVGSQVGKWVGMQVGRYFLVRSCLLITLIKCLKGHKSLGSLCNVVKALIVSGARRTDRQTMSPIELLWTAKKLRTKS